MSILRRFGQVTLGVVVLCLLAPASSAATDAAPPTPISVAIKPLDPFVVKRDDGSYAGYSIDVWQEIARRNNWSTTFVWTETVKDLLANVQDGKVDAGIAGLSMTKEREDVVDFSYPMFSSGLQVMVGDAHSSSWRDTLSNVFSPTLARLLGIVLLVLFVAGNFVWIFNRHRDDYPKGYIRGVGEGMWWAGSTITANEPVGRDPSKAWSRVVSLMWVFAGIIFVANLTASISSQLTVQSIRGQINGVDDLVGKRVVTVASTTAEKELMTRGLQFEKVTKIDEAYSRLLAHQVDAIVYDAPVLQYRALHSGQGKLRVVGEVFRPEPYGIALPTGSTLREQIDATLLTMTADGTLSTLKDRYFGTR